MSEELKKMGELLLKNSKDLDPEISKLVSENFWELLSDDSKDKVNKAVKTLEAEREIPIEKLLRRVTKNDL